ncbi:ATP-binding cassette domain-containing protein [Tranquillimonas alkanivorans]|uniref:Putative thiamine transport system ATP-binding protein n=1 Tax=Tranquillimonas alkanivorans TaxID=441119 RepID=A0A1I5LKQ6_9RHOB|nr:ATP-binding cassette domain-containing protein [Tranquillimonas alkanivorans]SFO97954.1 putative thiamine transport system ATP-binding protein [Tranquillimonas alkanivorans]
MAEGLELAGVRIQRNGAALVGLDHHVRPGEVLTVMGPSGVGKSTLLAFVTGTLSSDFSATGEVRLDGVDITHLPPERRRVGILFQDDLLFPHLSVADNLAFGLAPEGSRSARRAKVEAALADIELAGFGPRDPATLSGGQKARVALMRMLLAEPQALLLDEAFSGLDASLRTQMRDLVFGRARRLNLPVLMVTHDADDATAAGGPVVELTGR